MKRQLYRLINPSVKMNMLAMINNLPLDGSIQVVIEPYKKPRTSSQNALQWAEAISTIAEQAYILGKAYSPNVWHEFLKAKFLPEKYIEGETMEGYQKYIELPDGQIKMVGSTTKLTTKGFSNYMEQVYAYAVTELGVQFHANERQL